MGISMASAPTFLTNADNSVTEPTSATICRLMSTKALKPLKACSGGTMPTITAAMERYRRHEVVPPGPREQRHQVQARRNGLQCHPTNPSANERSLAGTRVRRGASCVTLIWDAHGQLLRRASCRRLLIRRNQHRQLIPRVRGSV